MSSRFSRHAKDRDPQAPTSNGGRSRRRNLHPAAKALTDRIPLRRYGEMGEVAESAVFLVSESARYVTGTILDCDDGSQLGDARDRSGAEGLQAD